MIEESNEIEPNIIKQSSNRWIYSHSIITRGIDKKLFFILCTFFSEFLYIFSYDTSWNATINHTRNYIKKIFQKTIKFRTDKCNKEKRKKKAITDYEREKFYVSASFYERVTTDVFKYGNLNPDFNRNVVNYSLLQDKLLKMHIQRRVLLNHEITMKLVHCKKKYTIHRMTKISQNKIWDDCLKGASRGICL